MIKQEIKFDKKRNKVVIASYKELDIDGDAEEIKKRYEERLRNIIQQVKTLKTEAEEIQSILKELKKGEPTIGSPSF